MIIVHVDDDDQILTSYGNVFSDLGHHYHPINDPQLAVDAITRVRPEIIILDVAMPYLNGIDLLKEIRSIDSIASTPVVFLTGMPYSLCGEQAKTHGARGYFSKKWHSPDALAEVLTQLV